MPTLSFELLLRCYLKIQSLLRWWYCVNVIILTDFYWIVATTISRKYCLHIACQLLGNFSAFFPGPWLTCHCIYIAEWYSLRWRVTGATWNPHCITTAMAVVTYTTRWRMRVKYKFRCCKIYDWVWQSAERLAIVLPYFARDHNNSVWYCQDKALSNKSKIAK